MDNPPKGITSKDICYMSEDELLDMDYFLNEDDLFDDQTERHRFLYLLNLCRSVSAPIFVWAIFIQKFDGSRTFL